MGGGFRTSYTHKFTLTNKPSANISSLQKYKAQNYTSSIISPIFCLSVFLAGKGGAFSSLRGIGASSEETGGGGTVGGIGGGGGGSGGGGGGGGGGTGEQVADAGGGAEKIWMGMSLGCCFFCVFLRLGAGAGWTEVRPSGGVDGSRLMRESGCEGHGSEGATLA